jgi:hypothetical protein
MPRVSSLIISLFHSGYADNLLQLAK